MSQDDLKLLIGLMEREMMLEQFQIASTKDFLARFNTLHQLTNLRSDLDKKGEVADELREQLDNVEREYVEKTADTDRKLLAAMARMESNHEQQEAILEKLKASLNIQS